MRDHIEEATMLVKAKDYWPELWFIWYFLVKHVMSKVK
jgi:hypothetical protein